MRVGVEALRRDAARVLDAVRAGERVILTTHGEPVAEIVPHRSRNPWRSGARLRAELRERAADAKLASDLEKLAGQRILGG